MQCCLCRNTSCFATRQLSACIGGCPAPSSTGAIKVLHLFASFCMLALLACCCISDSVCIHANKKLSGIAHCITNVTVLQKSFQAHLCTAMPSSKTQVSMLRCRTGCSSRRLKERLAELHARTPAPAPLPQAHDAQVLSNSELMPSALERQSAHHVAAARQDKDSASSGQQQIRHSSLLWLQRFILSVFQAPHLHDNLLRREPAVRTRHAL